MKTFLGIHDDPDKDLPGEGNLRSLFGETSGWVLHTVSIKKRERISLVGGGFKNIVRLNWGYGSDGTIPAGDYYGFAEQCVDFVRQTPYIDVIIIGNEPNHENERPQNRIIEPDAYAQCFALCYDAIKRAAPRTRIIPAAVAPYHANPMVWTAYLARMLDEIEELSGCDGLNVHAYTRSWAPADIDSDAVMQDAPLQGTYSGFRTIEDALASVPSSMRGKPVYATEFNPLRGWPSQNAGIIQAAARRVGYYRSVGMLIEALVMFRWNHEEPGAPVDWAIQDKPGTKEDFRAAVALGHSVLIQEPSPAGDDGGSSSFLPIVTGGGAGERPSPDPQPERRIDADFRRRVPQLTEHGMVPGRKVYRLVRAEYVPDGAKRFGPDHHILVDVVGADGERLMGVPVNFYWGSGMELTTINKAAEPYGADYAMTSAGHGFGVWVGNFREASDDVFGMGLGRIGSEHMGDHVSYFLRFQEVIVPAAGATEPPPKSDEKLTDEEPSTPVPTQPAAAGIVDPITALAFLQVESGNQPFHGGLLTIRVEIHRLRHWMENDELFNRHFKYVEGDYNQQFWRPTADEPWRHAHGLMPARHELLAFARGLNDRAALLATGMGLAQIMGSNYARIGYKSPQTMFRAFSHPQFGVSAQMTGFFNYVNSDARLKTALDTNNLYRAIQLYNGTGQEAKYMALLNNEFMKIRQALGLAEGG